MSKADKAGKGIDERAKLNELVDGFGTAMLTTRDTNGDMQARPMAVAEHDEEGGGIIFSSSMKTEKIAEMQDRPSVCVSFQSGTRYVSLTGTVTIDQDREKIHALWNKGMELWFPDGPDQPDICLIRFEPVLGEYWDVSGTEGVSFAWNAAKALVSGKGMPTEEDPAKHGEAAL